MPPPDACHQPLLVRKEVVGVDSPAPLGRHPDPRHQPLLMREEVVGVDVALHPRAPPQLRRRVEPSAPPAVEDYLPVDPDPRHPPQRATRTQAERHQAKEGGVMRAHSDHDGRAIDSPSERSHQSAQADATTIPDASATHRSHEEHHFQSARHPKSTRELCAPDFAPTAVVSAGIACPDVLHRRRRRGRPLRPLAPRQHPRSCMWLTALCPATASTTLRHISTVPAYYTSDRKNCTTT